MQFSNSNNKKSDLGQIVTALGTGIAVGTVVGSALANKKTRKKIIDTSGKIVKKMEQIKNNGPASLDELQDRAQELKTDAKNRYEEEKQKIDDYVNEKKEEYQTEVKEQK